jgi:CheY-like chemotaxis protein/anti-sigma regulatory factor (Ser/Thr protein kinase)
MEPDLALNVDATRISQVLSNLLDNAAKYTPPGGRLSLRARRDGSDVVISVSDNGIGLEPGSLPRVFDMFTQVGKGAQGGLGIGLSLVRRLVEMHGGEVGVESDGVDRGSTFTVRLPLDRGAAPAPPPAVPTGAAAGALEILIVDDNVDAAESLSALLALGGHSVRVAADGFEALRSVDELAPAVIFLDIGMPGMSGYEVAEALRRTRPRDEQLVIAAVTGWGSAEDKARARDAGFDHHLTKPIDLESVEEILNGVAARR